MKKDKRIRRRRPIDDLYRLMRAGGRTSAAEYLQRLLVLQGRSNRKITVVITPRFSGIFKILAEKLLNARYLYPGKRVKVGKHWREEPWVVGENDIILQGAHLVTRDTCFQAFRDVMWRKLRDANSNVGNRQLAPIYACVLNYAEHTHERMDPVISCYRVSMSEWKLGGFCKCPGVHGPRLKRRRRVVKMPEAAKRHLKRLRRTRKPEAAKRRAKKAA